jgi:hypothetical protein
VDQPVVRGDGHVFGADPLGADRLPHQALEHRRGAPHGVVPVHVAIHLVLGEEQRFESGEAFLVQCERHASTRTGRERERGEQPIDVDDPVGHAAHPCITREIVELVRVHRSRHEAGEGLLGLAADQPEELAGCHSTALERAGQIAASEVALGERFVAGQPGFLEGVRKRVMPDVVQQGGEAQSQRIRGVKTMAAFFEVGQRAPREVIRPECVLEARVCRAGVDEERVPERRT